MRLLLVIAQWQLMLAGTIWLGSHSDMQSRQLKGLTAGQLGKGIRPWELGARGRQEALRGERQEGGHAMRRQMEGLKLGIRSPVSSLTIWRATHSRGTVP